MEHEEQPEPVSEGPPNPHLQPTALSLPFRQKELSKLKCGRCGREITRSVALRESSRPLRFNMSAEQCQRLFPRCHSCMTLDLADIRSHS